MIPSSKLSPPSPRRILFAGYAPVHFLCFLPVYEHLAGDPELQFWFSGGFRHKENGKISYQIDGDTESRLHNFIKNYAREDQLIQRTQLLDTLIADFVKPAYNKIISQSLLKKGYFGWKLRLNAKKSFGVFSLRPIILILSPRYSRCESK